jgi:hypothetical protein
MPQQVFTAAKRAFGRLHDHPIRQPSASALQSQWDEVIRATGDITAQAYQKIGPMAAIQGQVSLADIALEAGLADVWTQEELRTVAQNPRTVKLMSPDGVPNPHFSYRARLETSATRDLLSEVLRQQGKELTSENYSSLCTELKLVPPDKRWTAIARMLPGGKEFENVLPIIADVKLESKFLAAVEASGESRRPPVVPAVQAVRDLAQMLKAGAAREQDPPWADRAIPAPGSAAKTNPTAAKRQRRSKRFGSGQSYE